MSEILWTPSNEDLSQSQMAVFKQALASSFNIKLADYAAMHEWSCQNPDAFWGFLADYLKLVPTGSYTQVRSQEQMPGVRWFEGASLNYAQACLQFNDDQTAIINANEAGEINRSSYAELREKVRRCQAWFVEQNIQKGDRVAAVVSNTEDTIVTFLAATALGAIWTSCSPDFGTAAIVSRFKQVEPSCLVFVDQYVHKQKAFSVAANIEAIFKAIPSLRCGLQCDHCATGQTFQNSTRYSDIQNKNPEHKLHFERMDFNDPLYILYSSGTTGKPKSIVHSIGGSLLEHIKEQRLHCDLKRSDVLFYYTSCSWMMWNWLVSGLASGACLLVFDGAPFAPNKLATWKLIDDYKITHYGTSAKYINASRNFNLDVQGQLSLGSLRMILSTGSPLYDDDFEYIYTRVKPSVQLCSISGGTDIVGCFALGNPLVPVRKGQLQAASLGYAVNAYDESGNACKNSKAELVCEAAAPSMPLFFWNDDSFELYKKSYFSRYASIWSQSDFVVYHDTGGLTFLGRSDATLNRAGIRIGTAEIYQQVEAHPSVDDALIIHIESTDHMILFITLSPDAEFNSQLKSEIKTMLKLELSPRHSPNFIFDVPAIPYTKNGKKIEVAVKQIFTHQDEAINLSSLQDASVLKAFKAIRDSAFAPA